MKPIYKTSAAEKHMYQWYQRFHQKLNFETESAYVDTTFGNSHVMISGPADAFPVVVLHGALAGAPHVLGELEELPTRYRMYVPDIPGQSVAGIHRHLDVKSGQYGQWLKEVIAGLKLSDVNLLAASWGGFVALNFAKHYPQLIRSMILLTPAGLVQGSYWQGFYQIYLPIFIHHFLPGLISPERALKGLCSSHHVMWTPYILDAMKYTRMNFEVPPLLHVGELNALQSPVYIFAADQDYSFPGVQLLDKARRVFPHLAGTRLLSDCKHCPPFESRFTKQWSDELEQIWLGLDRTSDSGVTGSLNQI